ncbi:PREDICTED: uncharacterized protein LOC106102193 [Papilio polytes]|uniref:uncharacterized protein LOC106102193 n=1 Tax=Papilio polytes TaxID=76194 RepID=UPI0006760AC8|nr:PREDICTED: uncharacterized protein LOC106102193 [Papilio polytes]
MTKKDYTGLAEEASKDYDKAVDGIIDPYPEDNDNVAKLLQEIGKVFDIGSTNMGPEFMKLLKQFSSSNSLIMESGNGATKLAEQEGDNELKCEHIVKSMD